MRGIHSVTCSTLKKFHSCPITRVNDTDETGHAINGLASVSP